MESPRSARRTASTGLGEQAGDAERSFPVRHVAARVQGDDASPVPSATSKIGRTFPPAPASVGGPAFDVRIDVRFFPRRISELSWALKGSRPTSPMRAAATRATLAHARRAANVKPLQMDPAPKGAVGPSTQSAGSGSASRRLHQVRPATFAPRSRLGMARTNPSPHPIPRAAAVRQRGRARNACQASSG